MLAVSTVRTQESGFTLPSRQRNDSKSNLTQSRQSIIYTVILTLAGLALAAMQPKYELQFKDGTFTILGAKSEAVRAIRPAPKASEIFAFELSGTWVVWDKRGLTIRKGDYVRTTKFADYATSPKLFSKEQILETSARIGSKIRSKEASGICGHEIIDSTLFLAIQWRESTGQAWMQTLVKINLAEAKPWATLVGKLNGLTLSQAAVADDLHSVDDHLVAIVTNQESWGVFSFSIKEDFGRYQELGKHLKRATVRPGETSALFIEDTQYGPERAGLIDLKALTRKPILESRGMLDFPSIEPPIVSIEQPTKAALRVPSTGLQVEFAKDTKFVSGDAGIIAYSPADKPQRAVLLRKADLQPLARWQYKQPTAAKTVRTNPSKK